MNRKTLFTCVVLGLTLGTSFSQKVAEPKGAAEIPAYINRFTNLSEEKRISYSKHKAKAEQFFRQKRTFECLEQIHQARKIFDEDLALWNLEGSCHVEFRSFNKAREAFKRGLAIDDRNTGILFNLAEMDFVTKRWEDCITKMTLLAERLEERSEGEMPEATRNLHHLAVFKKMLSQLQLGREEEARQLAKDNWDDWDDTPFTYYSKAALAYFEKDEEEANRWIMSAIRVFGGLGQVANWQDTLIEFGYIKSFYGGEDGSIELSN